MNFTVQKPHYEYLRKKWSSKTKVLESNLWDKHGKHFRQMAVGSLSGLMLLTAPVNVFLPQRDYVTANRDDVIKNYDKNILFVTKLKDKIPESLRPLTGEEENQITKILSDSFGFKVTAELEGIRLNRNYGLIGGEQHLYRYPGDSLYAHSDTSSEWAMYSAAGIAPALGAWGYFAPSKQEFGEIDKLREKYYLAVQTFLVPGFAENVTRFREFFKFRKMLVVNPHTGQAVVAVIGDAGPADWTGKHLGGSPEVIDALGYATGTRKGEVLYFFIDDNADRILPGPVKSAEKEKINETLINL